MNAVDRYQDNRVAFGMNTDTDTQTNMNLHFSYICLT